MNITERLGTARCTDDENDADDGDDADDGNKDNDNYDADGKTYETFLLQLPVKWMSPESLFQRTANSMSGEHPPYMVPTWYMVLYTYYTCDMTLANSNC